MAVIRFTRGRNEMVAKRKSRDREQRRKEVIARVSASEVVMAQHRDSRARHERGERGVPFAQIRAEAEERRRGA
jgi:hypothetical protein